MKLTTAPPVQLSMFVPTSYNVLIYGKNGTGKTIFGAGWPTPILLIDADKGIVSIIASKRIPDSAKNEIHVVSLSDISIDPGVQQPVGFLTACAVLLSVEKEGHYDGIQPKTIVVDSLTTLSAYAMTHVQAITQHTGKPPSLPDFGRQMNELREFIKRGVALDVNFICIAHEQYQKDENSGRIWCLPLVTGKLAPELGLYFDEVYHAEATSIGGVDKYQLITKASGLITAKSRLDLPSPIENDYNKSIAGTIDALKLKAENLRKGGGIGVGVPSIKTN
uniref:Putative ATPase domain containing protein n=1 Tax=viral metagenome TaxID=1070528 RepID=A0A6M3II42_9ZZZZ